MTNKNEQTTLVTEVKALREDVEVIKKNMATKDDFRRLAFVVEKNTHDIHEIKETMATEMATKDDVRLIIDTIDAFTKKVTVQERRALVNTHRISELEPQIKDHEKRLTNLESRR